MSRFATGVLVAVFGSLLTVIVAAAMGTTLMFLTPGTPTPTVAIDPTAVIAVGQFGGIVVGGVAVILLSAAAGGAST
jgi:hypothetical protein